MSNYVDVVLNGEDVDLPCELAEDEEIFKSVVNYQTWQNLSAADKAHLKKFLPSFPVNTERSEDLTARLVFSDDSDFKHGNAIYMFFRKLKAGCYNPRIVRQLEKCRKLKYKDYKLKEKQRYRRLLQEIIVSRQRILDQLARHAPGQPIRTVRSEPASLPYSVDEKVRKKYERIIKEVKSECEDEAISSDEEEDIQGYAYPSIPFYHPANHPGYRHSMHMGPPGMFMHSGPHFSPSKSQAAGQPMDVSDKGYRDMLESHRKRRICNEAHPELDVTTISLADVIMRANPSKKVNKKSKKIKKLKKGRDERMKVKKKNRPALPGLTAQDVLRIRQESGRQSTFEQEEVISEERIEEHLETTSISEEDDPKCFFELLKRYFVERSELMISEVELEKNVIAWESSGAAASLAWSKGYSGWTNLIYHALRFLAGKGNPLPEIAPLVAYLEETNEWKWIAIDDDEERILLPLCNLWLESIHQHQMEETEAATESVEVEEFEEEQPTNLTQQKTDFVVRPSTDHEKALFQAQERKRYENPHKPFVYRMHGFTSTVGPVKGVFSKDTGSSKAREHALLVSNRPAYVTILSLVRDAVARLPNGEGTRAEVCQLLKDSLFINPDASDTQIHGVVSGALDRLHAEKDPCVKYDTTRKLWVYLHRVRSVHEFEKIHQASLEAALAKKQMSQKQKSSSKKRQEAAEVPDDAVKGKSKSPKQLGDKSRKSSKKLKSLQMPLPNPERADSFEHLDNSASLSPSPLEQNFHSDFLMPKEVIVESSGQLESRISYFTPEQGSLPSPATNQCYANTVPLKITLPRGAIGSYSPGSMGLKIPKPVVQKGMIDSEHKEETEMSDHMIIDHDASEFLPRMDSSFEDGY